MKLQAVLFDLDGTLLDSIDGILVSFEHVLRKYLPERSYSREELINLIGEPVPAQMRFFVGEDKPRLIDEMAAAYREHNRARLPSVPLYDGAYATLAELRRRGFKVGLVTSKQRVSTMISIDKYQLAPAFDLIVTSDDTTKHKPDPEPLLHAARLLKLAPAQIAYVGDSVHDMRCALSAGSVAIAALWGPFLQKDLEALKPHRLVESLSALLGLVELAWAG